MKKYVLSIFMILFCLIGFAQTSWVSDPNHSRLGFTIEHLGINEITGSFDEFKASITSDDPNDLTNAEISLEASVGSINTGITPRDEHLRSADFFDVEKFPAMTFQSSSVERLSENRYKVLGTLSLHGVTKEVEVNMVYNGMIEDPQDSSKKTMGIQIIGEIKRSDFAIGEKFKEPMIGDVVHIKADGEFKNK